MKKILGIPLKPTNDADWSLDQKVLASAKITNNQVTITNIRNITYRSITDYTPAYYNKTLDLNKLKTVQYVLSPFSKYRGLAHPFLTFGFEDGYHISISIEVRKKKGQVFSPWKALFRQFELMYVVADERDVIKLRTDHRKDKVYVYPIKAKPEFIRKIFVDMLERVNKLRDEPEFYNLFTNSCGVNIAQHVNKLAPKTIPWSYKLILPQDSDRMLYELGLIDTELSFSECRLKYLTKGF